MWIGSPIENTALLPWHVWLHFRELELSPGVCLLVGISGSWWLDWEEFQRYNLAFLSVELVREDMEVLPSRARDGHTERIFSL